MPTYEYKCKKCGHRFEEFQNMTDPPVRTCPKCGGEVERLIGAGGGILFKGSGFYETDHKQGNSVKTRCGKEQTCCGRDVPCNAPPCKE